MRVLLDEQIQDVRAAEAVALFCYQIKKWIDDLRQRWGKWETLVSTRGIGEKTPEATPGYARD